MAFKSKKQWRWAFANKKKFARRWAHATPGGKGKRYKRLPAKAKARSGRKAKRKK